MSANELLDKIEHQLGIRLVAERQSKKWVCVTLPRHNRTILSYLACSKIKYEQHLHDSYYIYLK